MLIYQKLAFTTHGKILKHSCKNSKFKILAPTWNDKFELPDGSYSVSDIQYYFDYIIKTHKEKTDNPPIGICVNKIEHRITFRIKTGYYLELSTPETMKLLGNTKMNRTKDEICASFRNQ